MGNLLHVAVNNKIATYRQRDGSIVCGNKGYSVQFSFDAEWEEHRVKTARFIYNSHVVDTVFEGDTVEVPILRNTTLVAVGVFAGDLQTTTPAIIPCRKSILCSDGLPPDPEPDVYAQIMEMMANSGGSSEDGGNSESGIVAPVDGFFTMAVDNSGNLYVYSVDGNAPDFEYDVTTGNLYFVMEVD